MKRIDMKRMIDLMSLIWFPVWLLPKRLHSWASGQFHVRLVTCEDDEKFFPSFSWMNDAE